MVNWLNEVTLENEHVRLEPLRMQHKDALIAAASDGKLWELKVTSVLSPETATTYIQAALDERANDLSLPFAVYSKVHNSIVGCTRFCNAELFNKRLEIGYTWYAKKAQRTPINTSCKLLLLGHAFDKLKTNVVVLQTNSKNEKSINAILRLGAKQDGLIRSHRILKDGDSRDTAIFSILKSEWPDVKLNLEQKLNKN